MNKVFLTFIAAIALSCAAAAQTPRTPAPDFTATSVKGKSVSLSSLRGRYVVLDFWGSWCKNCIAGFPQMKSYYAKYKKKLEIVGIACSDSEARWKAATAKYSLPWTSVLNPSGHDIAAAYNVTIYPTKILIDPKGTVVGVYEGETDELYKVLDSLLAK